MCARHYGHAVYILRYLVRIRHYSYIQYTFEHLHVRICTFRNLFRQTDIYMRLSLSGCFRRSELLGCMTLPLPLSQDKVNITSGYLFETLDREMFALDSLRKYITLQNIYESSLLILSIKQSILRWRLSKVFFLLRIIEKFIFSLERKYRTIKH